MEAHKDLRLAYYTKTWHDMRTKSEKEARLKYIDRTDQNKGISK